MLKPMLYLGILLPGLVMAQVETARIVGHVKDQSGAVIPGATITITNTATQISFTTKAQPDGSYQSPPLQVGNYKVTAEQTGFKRAVRDGIVLEVEQTALVDLTMELGQVNQEVVVTGAAPLLTVNEPTAGQVIDNRKVVDLPLNGRDYIQLGLLSSGTDPAANGARTGGFSASGMRSTQNNYLLDGVDNNDAQIAYQGLQGEAVKPNVDAIQEFKVMTNSFSAQYGRATGAIINVTMKSGTNQLHGTAFEFIRNEDVDAENFFTLPGQANPPFKRNQFGFSVGGPIIRNKTFFFGDYEGSRIRESKTVNSTLPTPAMANGDFSQLLPGTTIYDPATYDASTGTRQPFPGNIIPSARFDSIGAKLAAFYPAPNKPGLSNNYVSNPPANVNLDHFDVKVDHTFSEKDNIYTRFSYQKTVTPPSPALPAPAYGSGTLDTETDRGDNDMLAWNHLFSPTFIASTKIAWNRLASDLEPPHVFYNQQLGLRGVSTTIPGMAQFTVSGYSSLGLSAQLPNLIGSQDRQLISDFTWIHGKHTVKWGVDLSWLQSSLMNPQNALGLFTFNGNYTHDPKTGKQGNSVADLLLGDVYQGQVSSPAYMNQRAPFYDFYGLDEWKVTSRLTLDLGLRYEAHLPWVETRNLWANFDIDTNPAQPALVLASNGSLGSRATVQPDLNDFAPRFGFAWQIGNKTVMRGGYGIYYAQYEGFGGAQYLEINPPFEYKALLTTDSITPLSLSQGLPPNLLSPQNASNIQTSSYDRHLRHGYSEQWSYSIQRELPAAMLLEVGYYANSAHKLMRRTEGNWALPGPGNINANRRYHSIAVPPNGVIVGPLAGDYRQQDDVNSNFNSLQVKVEKRLSNGLSVLASYMFSKAIDDGRGESGSGGIGSDIPQNPLDLRAERAIADEDRPHRFVASFDYELPFGHGKAFLSHSNRLVNGSLGGWTMAGIFTITSGQLATLSDTGNPSNTGGPDRPNVVHDWHLASGQTLQHWFDTTAFALNAPYTFGNAGRDLLRGPRQTNLDFAIYKAFPITERLHLQFRAEAFNATNTPAFGAPNAQLGAPAFGAINSAATPRNLQAGLKAIF